MTLAVRVTPRAGRDAVGGLVADAAGRLALAVRTAAPAEGGRANAAAAETLAKALGVPKSSVRILAGAVARDKRLEIAGDPQALSARLEALAAG